MIQLHSVTRAVDLGADNLADAYRNATRYYAIKDDATRLDCFQTVIRGNVIRHYVCAYGSGCNA